MNQSVSQTKLKTNQETEKANLTWNVNNFKRWIKTFYKKQDTFPFGVPQFKGAHIGMTCVSEVLCKYVVEKCVTVSKKDVSGLYNVEPENVLSMFRSDIDLVSLRYMCDTYDSNLDYTDQFCVTFAMVKSFVENKFGKNVMLHYRTFNLIAYMLLKTATHFAILMASMAKEFGKQASTVTGKNPSAKSLDFRTVRCCVTAFFSNTNLQRVMIQQLEEVESRMIVQSLEKKASIEKKASVEKKATEKVPEKQTVNVNADALDDDASSSEVGENSESESESESDENNESESESESSEKEEPKKKEPEPKKVSEKSKPKSKK